MKNGFETIQQFKNKELLAPGILQHTQKEPCIIKKF